jgi:FixJ family two-component response regulator
MDETEQATIFLIDDDQDVLDAITRLLKAAGFQVTAYNSAQGFLNSTTDATIGCVVSDLAMPEMNGLELSAIMANRRPHMPMVIITGHGEVPLAVSAMKNGVFDFIEKPFDPREFIQLVHRTVEELHERDEAREISRLLSQLGERETEVLDLIVEGLPTKAIAARLGSSFHTVRNQRSQVLRKMNVSCTAELVRLVTSCRRRQAKRHRHLTPQGLRKSVG